MTGRRIFLNIILISSFAAVATLAATSAIAQVTIKVNKNNGVDNDLVVPRKGSYMDEDTIQTEKRKNIDVSDKDAQSRKKPKEENNHVTLIPFPRDENPPELKKKLKNGTKVYAYKPSPQDRSAGFTVGGYNPTNLVGTTPGVTFQNIYGGNTLIYADFNYEYQFFKSAGKLGVRGDLGFFTTKGQGRFVHNVGQQADEVITLVGLPIGVSAVYHLHFWENQPIVPYAFGGLQYFAIFEGRGDKKGADALKYGGSPTSQVGAGVQIMLDYLDKQVLWQLDQDYGINHIYLTADVKQILGLGGSFDFTSSLMFEGGILFEF